MLQIDSERQRPVDGRVLDLGDMSKHPGFNGHPEAYLRGDTGNPSRGQPGGRVVPRRVRQTIPDQQMELLQRHFSHIWQPQP